MAPPRGLRVNNKVYLAWVQLPVPPVVAAVALGGRYDPHVFMAWQLCPRGPPGMMSCFRDKLVVVGLQHDSDALLTVYQLSFALQKRFRLPAPVLGLQVQNVIGSAHLGYCVRLQRLYEDHRHCCNYDPQNFPGLQYRYYLDTPRHAREGRLAPNRSLHLTVFERGKVVLTGAERLSDLEELFDRMQRLFWRYRASEVVSRPTPVDQVRWLPPSE